MSKIKHTIYTKNDQDKVELTPALRSLAKKVITAALDYQEIDNNLEEIKNDARFDEFYG